MASTDTQDEPREYTVMTDGATFPKDKLSMRKDGVPEPEEPDPEVITCHVGDVVSLTEAEAKAARGRGVALGGPKAEPAT